MIHFKSDCWCQTTKILHPSVLLCQGQQRGILIIFCMYSFPTLTGCSCELERTEEVFDFIFHFFKNYFDVLFFFIRAHLSKCEDNVLSGFLLQCKIQLSWIEQRVCVRLSTLQWAVKNDVHSQRLQILSKDHSNVSFSSSNTSFHYIFTTAERCYSNLRS